MVDDYELAYQTVMCRCALPEVAVYDMSTPSECGGRLRIGRLSGELQEVDRR